MKTMVARSADYTVVMHFNDAMKTRLLSGADQGYITQTAIEAVFDEYDFVTFKKRNILKKQLNLPSNVDLNLEPGMTIKINKRNDLGLLDYDIVNNREFDNDQAADIHKAQMKQSLQRGSTLVPVRNSEKNSIMFNMGSDANANVKNGKNPTLTKVGIQEEAQESDPSIGDRHDDAIANKAPGMKHRADASEDSIQGSINDEAAAKKLEE